jgi:hypothetical protein
MGAVIYAKAFFDLQLRFAETVSALSDLPFDRAVLEYTNLYARFGFGRDFDPAPPVWQEFLAGRGHAIDDREWTYRFYLARAGAEGPPGIVATFGCFSYVLRSDGRIRLHFLNAETDGRSPLGIERREHRLADLAALFAHVKQTRPEPSRVLGASWLYNLEAYGRLFPKSYLATARALRGRFQHMPLWGQFVDRRGELKESLAQPFRTRLERQSSLEDLDECFRFQVLTLEAPMHEFYEFYGV